jgi:hypothetical protein
LLETGATHRNATYVSGSGTSTLVFSYTVQAGDTSTDLEYESTSALATAGTIKDSSNNDFSLILPALATANSLGGSKAIIIDTAPPAAPSGLSLNTPTTSPNYITTPSITVSGVVENDNIRLYTDSGCSTSTGSPATVAGSQTTVNVSTSTLTAGSYTFYANSTDTVGNPSACSTANVAYVVDLTAPTVASSTPNWATAAGGSIAVSGNHFYSGSTVTVAGNPCTSVTVTPPNSLTCTAPASNMLIDGNMEAAGTASWLDFHSSLSKQTTNPHSGSRLFRITAAAFAGARYPQTYQTILTIGKKYRATGYVRSDGTQIPNIAAGQPTIFTGTASTAWQPFDVTFTTTGVNFGCYFITNNPAGTEYIEFDDVRVEPLYDTTANIAVTTPVGTGTGTGIFTYYAAPTITTVAPSTGNFAGGDTITITGTNFQQTGITVNFDTGPSIAAAQSVIRNSAEQLTVVTPAHAVGTVAVTVTNIDGQYAVAATGFTFANLSFTKLGDDSADYVLPSDGNGAYAAELNFNVGLTAGQKTIIENAVTAGADHTTAYLWSNGNKKLTISATVPTTFNNDVIATIAAVNLLLIDSKLETAQVTATTNTSVTTSTPQVVVETLAPITVTVPSNTTNATLNVDSLTTGNTGTLPEITVNATTAGGSYQIAIPASTTVTAGAAWNSVIELPTEKAVNTVTVTPTEGKTTTVSTVISIGSETVSLSFNKGVRLKFTNARNKLVGFYRNSTFAPITTTCTLNSVPTDSQAAGDQLAPDGDCKINSGTDLIVWTKHFTDFIIYDEMGALTVTDVNSDLGSINGQQHVVITGTNFGTGAIASFDGTDAPSTYVLNGTTILAVTPTGSVGPVDVAVRNLTGTPAILTYGYTYDIDSHLDIPAVDTIVPITGSTLGGTPTTITGSGFLAGATAYFGQNSAQTTTISNSTTILAATRSHAAGAVDVIVVNLDGTWGIGTDLFTYETPAGAAICGPGTSQQCATQEITCYEGSLSFGRTPNSITFDSQVASGNIKQSYDSAVNDGLVLTNTNVLSVIDTRSGNTTNCPLSLKGFIVQAEATQLNNNNGTSPPISNTNLRVITSNELNPINPICERADGLEACYGAAEGTGNLRDITAPVLYDDFARLLADQYLKFNQPDPYLYKAEDGNLVTNVSDTYPQGDAPSPTPLLNILSGPVDLLTTNTSHNQTIYTGVAVKAEIPAGQDPGTYTGTITYTLAAQ